MLRILVYGKTSYVLKHFVNLGFP